MEKAHHCIALYGEIALDLLTRTSRNPVRIGFDTTKAGLGENHSFGGVFAHIGLVSASINNRWRRFLGVGERNE